MEFPRCSFFSHCAFLLQLAKLCQLIAIFHCAFHTTHLRPVAATSADEGEASVLDGQFWHPSSSKWWPQHLNETSTWNVVSDLYGVVGAHVASDRKSFACLLVLQDACHVGTTHQRSGAWYSPHGHDLSRLATPEDVCGHRNRELPSEFTSFWAKSDIDRMTIRQGALLANKPPVDKGQDPPVTWYPRAMVSPHDSFNGHLIERVGSWAELAWGLRRSLGSPQGDFPLDNISMLFGTSAPGKVSTFGSNMSKILFGSTEMLGGLNRPDGVHECFKEAIFTLNWAYSKKNAALLRDRIYEMTDKEAGLPSGKKLAPVQQPYQVSWAWRSGRRRIVNRGEVAALLMEHFQGIPVVLVEHAETDNFYKMVHAMRHTAFFFGMHGGAFCNVFFLPANASVLEILPFKFKYYPYMMLGQLFGLRYHQWSNTYKDKHTSDNDCFKPWYAGLSEHECEKDRSCFRCVKNHALTAVHIEELNVMLTNISKDVKTWVREKERDAS